jgi:hypothetical protein
MRRAIEDPGAVARPEEMSKRSGAYMPKISFQRLIHSSRFAFSGT